MKRGVGEAERSSIIPCSKHRVHFTAGCKTYGIGHVAPVILISKHDRSRRVFTRSKFYFTLLS